MANKKIIPAGLRADVMRNHMEDKDTLETKGSIYVGLGTKQTVNGVQIAETTSLEPANGNNFILVTDSTQNVGLKWTDSPSIPGTLEVNGVTTLNNNLNIKNNNDTKFSVAHTTGNTTVGGTLAVSGNTTVGGTLGVTGATTLTSVSTSGAATLNSAAVTTNATVGGTLGVTGNTSLTTVSTSGAATLNSATVTNNATVGGTLGVTGDFSVNTDKFTVDDLTGNTAVAGNATVGGTLAVTGATTLGGLTAGASTLSSATVTGNETVGGTLGVTGAVTGASFNGFTIAAGQSVDWTSTSQVPSSKDIIDKIGDTILSSGVASVNGINGNVSVVQENTFGLVTVTTSTSNKTITIGLDVTQVATW